MSLLPVILLGLGQAKVIPVINVVTQLKMEPKNAICLTLAAPPVHQKVLPVGASLVTPTARSIPALATNAGTALKTVLKPATAMILAGPAVFQEVSLTGEH